jgi:phenylpropionate dioxygenase-like ring-hydroxylating dioxygenase large terminal subunit
MLQDLVDSETALVSRRAFSDEEIYQLEQERIFGRCWLFLGHESQIPRPGNYLTNTMAEDSVIVCRDPQGRLRAFLNTCRHRGNKVCLFDRGHASTFTCTYHGWSYNTEGKLVGVPFFQDAYYGELDREHWGLVEVPMVASYGGMIFGCWDAEAGSLEEYLGDLRWYLDKLYLAEDMGGLEVLPWTQRYRSVGNWKIPADNFHGDHYHTPYAHGSSRKLGIYSRNGGLEEKQTPTGAFEVGLGPHGLGGLRTGTETYERDLAQAERLGPEVLEWVKERFRRLQERLKDTPAKPYGFIRATIFPNFSINGAMCAFGSRGFYLWHPRGPLETEVWQWCAVERAAPRIVKELAATGASRGQSASGLFGQDDNENFERVTENTRTFVAQRFPFHYAMALEHDGRWPGQEEWDIRGLPGAFGPHIAEMNQRRFYAHWAKLMDGPGPMGGPSGRAFAPISSAQHE